MFQLINTITFCSMLCVSSATASTSERISFQWSDINTREVVDWEGDTAIIQQGSSATELKCKISLDLRLLHRAVDMFGIPDAWTSFTYTDEKDLKVQQKELEVKAKARGMKLLPEGNRFTVDYQWVVNRSTKDVKGIAQTIRSAAKRQGYRSRRALVGAIASFVQSLEYRIPPDHRINDDGGAR